MGGGAEMMLYRLLSKVDFEAFRYEVISFTDEGVLGTKIRELGASVYSLGMRRGRLSYSGIKYLKQLLKKNSPSLVQTWMYHADLIGGIIAKQVTSAPIVWNLRADIVPFSSDKRTFILTKACAILSSSLPSRIISCSEAARKAHISFGYDDSRIITLQNGFDLNTYKPDQNAYLEIREELRVQPNTLLIGVITRYDKRKDVPTLVAAIARLTALLPNVRFLLCGSGMEKGNLELMRILDHYGVRDCCFLLGRREDIPRLTAAFDIATSSSLSEGFPNVLGEAMACGVPCVATNVGDSAIIIGEAGTVVSPENPEALANAWRKILEMSIEQRHALGFAARHRIDEYFNITSVVIRYENLYRELLNGKSTEHYFPNNS